MEKIKLRDILKFENTDNVKIRFVTDTGKFHFNPLSQFNKDDETELCRHQYFNYKSKRFFKKGEITIGFVRIFGDKWLLFHIGKVTNDLNIVDGVGYEFESLPEYRKYIGRLIINYHNKGRGAMSLVVSANKIMDCILVDSIIPHYYEDDLFPGYENVCLDWEKLRRVIDKSSWITALQNQKGVYLITDKRNGKMYVGSARGEEMLLRRWRSYIENGHGGNVELKKIAFEDIKQHFQYSILDIYKNKTDDQIILDRETYWKNVLLTKQFGYNKN